MRHFRDTYIPDPSASVLDVGAAIHARQRSYRELFADYDYTGMDVVAGPNVDIVGYENIPRTYDAVISGQVMEHVARPWEWLPMVFSYTHKYICIIAPNSFAEHRIPIDTFRFFPDGMRELFKVAGIKELDIYRFYCDTVGIGVRE